MCGYPISGPPDALDQVTASLNRFGIASSTFSLSRFETWQKFNYGEFVRNLEKKHRFSYNEIDEPLQPVMDDEEIELSLLAQPVSQPPSEDGFRASTSRPIAPSKDSSEEDSDEYDEIRKVKKDPPAEEAPVKHETDDIKVALESDNEKESDSEEEAHSQEEKLPASDVAQESEVEAGSPESPQVENGNSDDVTSVQSDQTPVVASEASEESALPVADAPVMSVSDEEPKGVQAVGPAQEEDSPSLDVAVKPEQSEPEVVLSELERVVASDAFESLDNLPLPAFEAEEDTKEVQAAESPVEDSPSTDFPVQFVPVESEASGDSASPALDAQEVPKEVLAAEEAPSTDFPVQFVPQEDEVVVPVAPSENGEGSGSLVANTLKEEEKTSDLSLDGLEGSGFVADAQPEKHSVVNDGEEGSGAADPVIISDEGSGFFADPEKAGVLAEEGSGASNEPSEELKVSAPIVDETGDVAVAAVEADGSGDADSALDAPHADQTVESDKPSLQEEAHSSPVEDHVEQSDVSPIKEEAKVEEAADGAEKYIPVEVSSEILPRKELYTVKLTCTSSGYRRDRGPAEHGGEGQRTGRHNETFF